MELAPKSGKSSLNLLDTTRLGLLERLRVAEADGGGCLGIESLEAEADSESKPTEVALNRPALGRPELKESCFGFAEDRLKNEDQP